MAKTKYDNNSIELLKGADRVRKRPAAILGSDGIEGCEHAFLEILANSIDESREGYGKVINVTVFRDHSIIVEDFGRGVPLDWNEKEQRYNWELVFCELYAGGKYHNAEGGDYEYSLGLNGLGACATQYSSEYMEVTVYSGDTKYYIDFYKGEKHTDLQKEPHTGKKRTGTVIKWRPDIEVFTSIDMPLEFFTEVLHKQAVVNDGLTLNLRFEDAEGKITTASYRYENGILDYVREIAGMNRMEDTEADGDDISEDDSDEDGSEDGKKSGRVIITDPVCFSGERVGRDREDLPEYKLRIQAAFCFANRNQRIEYYHNSSYLEFGGSPDKAVRSSFTKAIDNYLRTNNKYNKNEPKITFQDVEDCLILVINSSSTMASYLNQTKKAITNPFITEAMTEFFLHKLEVYFAENHADAERIATQVLINKRSRESAESARINIKKKLSGSLDISNRVEKFVNCRSKDPEKRELFIVEGDSALSSCVLGRNSTFQAIIPVRGKTLNCLKASYDRIFKSDIIVDLLKVIGCGVEIKSKSNKEIVPFDISALKWRRIIICTDADEDGFQIRTLILTMLYRLLPTLIREGKVFIAESPLYEITAKDGIHFAYDEKEKAEIIEKLGDSKYTVQRSKGLGENEPEMMWKTTMCPATRRLVKIMPEDEEKTYAMFNTLLGDDLAARKRFIAENGYKYIDLADV
ncbi:MAG: toprim domain-containing protein [Firmicutes bacterium]|nr:toprim domain-containing protein [Bacillota bacterium]